MVAIRTIVRLCIFLLLFSNANVRAQNINNVSHSEKIEVNFLVNGVISKIPDEVQQEIDKIDAAQASNTLVHLLGRDPALHHFEVEEYVDINGKREITIKAERQKRVIRVKTTGLTTTEESDFSRLLRLKTGDVLNLQRVWTDAQRLTDAMHAKGYRRARVTQKVIERGDQTVEVEYSVRRSIPCLIAEVNVEPRRIFMESFASPVVPGHLCNEAEIRDSIERDKADLHKQGFWHAEYHLVPPIRYLDDTRAVVNIHYVPGPKTVIEIVNRVNNSSVSDALKERGEVILDSFSAYSPTEIRTDPNLGIFEDIRAEVRQYFKEQGYPDVEIEGPSTGRSQPDEIHLLFQVNPKRQIFIEDVNLNGDFPFNRSQLLSAAELERTTVQKIFGTEIPYVEANLEKYRERLRAFFINNGYLNAKISNPEVVFSETTGNATISIKIEEGDQYLIHQPSFVGLPKAPLDLPKLEELLAPGTPWTPERRDECKAALLSAFITQGYRYAREPVITASKPVKSAQGKQYVDIVVTMEHGPLVRIGDIRMEGDLLSKDNFVLAEANLKRGDILTPQVLFDARWRLQNHALFANVFISIADEEPTDTEELKLLLSRAEVFRDILIQVKSPGLFSFGVSPRFGNEKGYQVQFDGTSNQFLQYGLKLFSQLSVSQEKQQRTLINQPQVLGRNLGVGAALPMIGNRIFVTDLVTTLATGVDVFSLYSRQYETAQLDLFWRPRFAGWPLTTSLRLLGEHSRALNSTIPILEALDRADGMQINEIGFSVALDTRNARDWPIKGTYIGLTPSLSNLLFSDVQFLRYSFDASAYFPLSTNWTLALSAGSQQILDILNANKETVTAPLSRRGFLAGKSQVRGFPTNTSHLGPVLWQDVVPPNSSSKLNCRPIVSPTGATNILYTKTEARRKRPDSIWGYAFFIDTGIAYFTRKESDRIQESLAKGDQYYVNPDGSDCQLKNAALIGNDAADMKIKPDRTFVIDYLRNGYLSTGFGIRMVIQNVASLNLDWGIPLRDPSYGKQGCIPIEQVGSYTVPDTNGNNTPPSCLIRRPQLWEERASMPESLLFSARNLLLRNFNLSIGATF